MSDWNPQANEIFLAAIELASPAERRALLDERCGGDAHLREQVESLLAASEHAGDFLERPAVEGPETARLVGDSRPETPLECTERTQLDFREDRLDFLSPVDAPDVLGRIGPYEVTELIGRGGMGIVLKALDEKLNRIVAVKVLAPELSGNATARRRFLREAQAAAAVTHQHVVTIHAVDEDRLPYLVMEFVDGPSLQQKIDRDGPLGLKEILRIGSQVASGLAAAHAQGLIHRDIKPANILLENGVERVRITDFGLARAVDDVSVTRTGEVHGTPQYMSPEQAEGKAVDARTDLFNLGCVLYAMCTGRSPFRADTTVAAIRRVCDDAPRPIREVNQEIPQWLVDIVDRLLEKDPDDRIQTATEAADLLGRHLAHVQDPGSVPRPESPGAPGQQGKPRRWWMAAVVLSLLTVIGLGLLQTTGVINLTGTGQPTGTADTEPDAGVTDEPRAAPRIVGPGGAVDLLRLIDPENNPMVGQWWFENDALVSPGTGRWDRLDILYPPPEEYDLEVTAERTSGDDMLSITLLSGEHQFFVGLDMFEGRLCGLGLVDGKDAFTNETTIERSVFGDRLPHKIVCRVRQDSVGVDVDGQTVIDWAGNLDRLSIPEYGRTGHLGLMAMRSEYRFFDVVLKPVRSESSARPVITEIRQFDGHTGSVKQVAVSRDGTLALSCSGVQGDRSVRLWEVETGREIQSFDTSGRQILAVRFSHDEQHAVGAGFGGTVSFWDVETRDLFRSIESGSEVVTDLELSPDGRHLLCATHQRAYPTATSVPDLSSAQLWDLDTEELVWQFNCPGWLETCEFLRDNEHIVVAGRQTGCAVHLLDLGTGDELQQFNLGDVADHQIEELAVSHDGQLIATASELGYVCLWDVNAGVEPVDYRSNMGNLRSVAFSPGDDRLLCAGGEGEAGSIQLLELPGLEIVASVEHPGGLAWEIAYLPDGQRALSAGGWSDEGPGDFDLRLWQIPETADVAGSTTTSVVMPEQARYATTHTGPVLSVAVSLNGRVIATGSSDNTIQLFDRNARSLLHELPGGTSYDLKFTADGRQLLSAGEDGTVRLWDVETGEEIRRFTGHHSWVVSVDLSMDGRTVLTCSHDGTIRFWDFESTNQLHEIDLAIGKATQAFSVRFDADGDRFVSAHADGTVTIWNAATREEIRTIPAHEGMAYIARFSPDGRTLLTTGDDEAACLWDIDSGRRLHRLPHGERVTEGEFLFDGRFVVTSSRDKAVTVWNVQTGRKVSRAIALTHYNSAIAPIPDRDLLVSAGGLLDGRTENGKMVWEGDGDYDIRLWRLPTTDGDRSPAPNEQVTAFVDLAVDGPVGEVRRFEGHTHEIGCLAFSNDGRRALAGDGWPLQQSDPQDRDFGIRVLDLQTNQPPVRLLGEPQPFRAVVFDRNGRFAISAAHVVRSWDLMAGSGLPASIPQIPSGNRAAAFTGDGRRVVISAHDRRIRLWETETGKLLNTFEGHTEAFSRVAISSDGSHVLAGVGGHHVDGQFFNPTGNTLWVWDADSAQLLHNFGGHQRSVVCVAISPDGRFAVTGCGDRDDLTASLWDIETGERLQVYEGHTDTVSTVVFSPDGRYLLTGADDQQHLGDGSLRLWDVTSGEELYRFPGHEGGVRVAVISPDGRYALSGGIRDGTVILWRLPQSVWSVDESNTSIEAQLADLTSRIEQAPENGPARIERAQLYVRQSRWQEAVADLEAAGEAVYEEPGNAFLYAILLVHQEQFDLHQQHCEKLLERFADTDDVWTANCLVKSCLLRPGVVDLDRLPTDLLSDDHGFASGEPGWVLSEARALFAYRNGDYEKAREQLRDTMDEPSYRDDPLYAPRALSILAMAAHQSGDAALAQGLYDRAVQELQQIQLESDDIRAFGWIYAEILRREAADLLRPGAFVILGKSTEQVFDTLAQAVRASRQKDTIEICGNGPFVTEPIVLRHALVLRAADGFQPVIQRTHGLSHQDAALITTHAPLVVEGLTFQHDLTDIEDPKFLDSYDVDRLRVANCRFVMTSQEGYAITGEARDVDVRNCEFVMPGGYSVAFTCHPNGRWVIDNCVHVGTIGFFHPAASTFRIDSPDAQRPASVHLSRNTVVAATALDVRRFRRSSLPENATSPAPIQILASSNLFDTWSTVFLSSFQITEDVELPPVDAASLPVRLIDWRGQRNVFPARGHLILLRFYNRLESSEKSHAIDLSQWDEFWGSADVGSLQGPVRFEGEYRDGEFVPESETDYASLSAEDFRLHSDSAGYQAEPDGQDLGADVDIVGPGEAYERWKQTPEYAEWLNEVTQVIEAASGL